MLNTLIIINIGFSAVILFFEVIRFKSGVKTGVEDNTSNVYKRDYTDYDNRIATLKEELELAAYNNAPSNAGILAKGVYNLEHSSIDVDSLLYPIIEQEKPQGYNEIAN